MIADERFVASSCRFCGQPFLSDDPTARSYLIEACVQAQALA
jgi:hypothetical protein